MSPTRLRTLVRLIKKGGVIAYPTEAVFGLGCDPRNEAAVKRIIRLKQRRADKGLILIAASLDQLLPWLEPISAALRAKLEATWPGPVTWLLPARPEVPVCLRGKHSTLAVRVTVHPIAAALCQAYGTPLVSTSANISKRPPARTALAVRRQFGKAVDTIVPGAVGGASRPTEIRSLDDRVIRSA